MNFFKPLLIVALLFASSIARADDSDDDPKFPEKLNEMLMRTEKSIKLLREQIVESTSAPFLPELYLQLGDLLAQKSNTLYYVQMEKLKKTDTKVQGDKEFSPVILSQKEAISIFKLILRDFPKFRKRNETMFRLALALKSIDEVPEFLNYSSQLLSLFPDTEEAMKVRLLLGQHFFDQGDFNKAESHLIQVSKVKFIYEKNLAKYRIGLIQIARERYPEALKQFEEVITDPQLREQDNPYNIGIQSKGMKTDLKREALIDSIRAYTHVYPNEENPAAYYAKICPTEVHFQEVIEKLAVRYINLKKYTQAVRLLRTLSERTPDPQKVINIYQEVLVMIPPKDRIAIPFEEIRFVLDRFTLWSHYFELNKRVAEQSYNFFEKQVRELGTTAHDLAKVTKDAETKKKLFMRARDFYHLYIGFFEKGPNAVKMATNLADVYFILGDFMRSGDFYLRAFSGEFGAPPKQQMQSLIENSILSLQKRSEYGFYENIRVKGLLIRAIESYVKFNPKEGKNPKTMLAKLKAEYDQGFFPAVLDKLLEYMRTFRNAPQAIDAGDLILDYFNTRNDFAQLHFWSDRILALKLPNPTFNGKVQAILKTSKIKAVQEKVKSISGYDEFAQGKSYLEAALTAEGDAIADEALKQALARSRSERDINTYIQAAGLMAEKTKDPAKKMAIQKSIAAEYLKVTRFYDALEAYYDILNDTEMPDKERIQAMETLVNTALLLKDWKVLEKLISHPISNSLSPATRARLKQQVLDLLESPTAVSPKLVNKLVSMGMAEDTLAVLFRAQFKVESNIQQLVQREIKARCGAESKIPACRWGQLENVDNRVRLFEDRLDSTPKTVEGIQAIGPAFLSMTGLMQSMEGSGDPYFETAISVRSSLLYTSFAKFLQKAANSNADLKPVLLQKAQETSGSAKLYLERCRTIGSKSAQIGSTRFCELGEPPMPKHFFKRKVYSADSGPGKDPTGGDVADLQKMIFAANKESPEAFLKLSKLYLDQGQNHHAGAAAAYGSSLYKNYSGEFHAIQGCSQLKVGLYDEAAYHLKNATDFEGLRSKCLESLKNLRASL